MGCTLILFLRSSRLLRSLGMREKETGSGRGGMVGEREMSRLRYSPCGLVSRLEVIEASRDRHDKACHFDQAAIGGAWRNLNSNLSYQPPPVSLRSPPALRRQELPQGPSHLPALPSRYSSQRTALLNNIVPLLPSKGAGQDVSATLLALRAHATAVVAESEAANGMRVSMSFRAERSRGVEKSHNEKPVMLLQTHYVPSRNQNAPNWVRFGV